MADDRAYALYPVGPDPICPEAWAHTFLDGKRRVALIQANAENVHALDAPLEDHLPRAAPTISEQRGWEPGGYVVFLMTPQKEFQLVPWADDLKSDTGPFGVPAEKLPPHIMGQILRSFPEWTALSSFSDRRYEPYPIGGDHVFPQVYAHTLCDSERRTVVAQTNPKNPFARSLPEHDYLPAVVFMVKEKRGWDYGTYRLYACAPDGVYHEVTCQRDPLSREPVFEIGAAGVSAHEVKGIFASFRPPGREAAPGVNLDLSKFHAFDHELE